MIRHPFRVCAAIALLLAATAASAGPRHDDRDRYGLRDDHRDRSFVLEHRAEPRRGHDRYRESSHRRQQAHRYAAISVDQARELRRLGRYPDHPRWSLDYERHLHWALNHPGWRLEREIRRRALRLRELRTHYRGHRYGPYRRW
jgi:hypothetical protein